MQQMELREQLDEVKFSNDTDAALSTLQSEIDQQYQALFNLLQQQINENSAQSNAAACNNLRKLKFYQKLNVEVERVEDSLFDD